MSDVAVECRAVTKEFGSGEARATVLRGIDLQVFTGQMTFLVGPSGCGKTTLISAMAGMLAPSSGSIEVCNTELDTLRGPALTRFRGRMIGFIFQQFNLLPALTAAENASVPLLVRGQPAGASRKQATALLDRLGMGVHCGRYPNELSGGQQQRVAIARALIHDPTLVVCDEPTASLDADAGEVVMTLLREMALRRGRAVIVVTHDDRIVRYADRIATMADGRIVDVAATSRLQAA